MFHILLYIISIPSMFSCATVIEYKQNPAVNLLQKYIQLDTQGLKNTDLVVEFWRRQAADLNLGFSVYEPAGLPICVLTWEGKQPHLPSIMLNSHSDVVPVEDEQWIYNPFEGYIDDDGNMYGRGTQDTKSVSIQYIEAIRKLISSNTTLDRTVHVSIFPDEETGGFRGMVPFVESDDFKSLNVGFVLDEGMTSPNDVMYATYLDKRPWQVKFDIRGKGGHGATASEGNAAEKLQTLINLAMDYRNQQMNIANAKDQLDFGSYTTTNINIVEGGIAPNVIPSHISVVIDMRLATSTDVNDFQAMLDSWLAQLGTNSTMHFIRRAVYSAATAVDDSNPYWVAMRDTLKDLNITLTPLVCPATSDMLSIREKGIPAIGFSTRTNMISNMHDSNEYIRLDVFLRGIDIYVALISRLATLPY